MIQRSPYWKKIFGTSSLLAGVGATVLVGAAVAGARFIDTGHQLIFDAQVVSIDDSSMEVVTSGTDPITVQINNRTVFVPRNSPVVPGDDVSIIARTGNNDVVTARVVRKTNGNTTGYGYGRGGQVVVNRGEVIAKGSDSFTVDMNGADVTFKVNTSTRFVRGNFSSLERGDEVQVIGQDNGTAFIARTVIIRH